MMKKIILLCFVLITSVSLYAAGPTSYCLTSAATNIRDEEIFNVTFGTLNNTTDCLNPLISATCVGTGSPNKYADFTSCSPASFLSGLTYPFSVEVNSCNTTNYGNAVKIYIDWNQDGDFVDAGEEVFFSGTTALTCVPATIVTGNILIPLTAKNGVTRMRVIDKEGGQTSTTSITPCASYGYGETEDYLINIVNGAPCAGTPYAGKINQPDTVIVCPTSIITLCDTGGTSAQNLQYTWLKSTNGGATWSSIPSTNSICYTIPAGTPSALYKMSILCMNSFGFDTTANAVYVNDVLPSYVPVPYLQNFETWGDYCSNSDVPNDGHWVNTPNYGDESWRRNDQGPTAYWNNTASGAYIPPYSSGSYSARFHTYDAGSSGSLKLYVNLSSALGNKDLIFDTNLQDNSDTLVVDLSTNGGITFTNLQTFTGPVGQWTTQIIPLVSNAPNCVLRFSGNGNNLYSTDIGLDNLKILPPCGGVPQAGMIPDTSACPNDSFTLKLIGSSNSAALTYTWQSSPTSTGPWTTYNTTTLPSSYAIINAPTYFQCIVTCTASGLSSTTLPQHTTLNTFYYCYCHSAPTSIWDNFDIGCVQLLKQKGVNLYDTLIYNVPIAPADTFNNTWSYKSYTNYQFALPIKQIFIDSLYLFKITDLTQSSWSPSAVTKVYIDFDRNGVFDPNDVAIGASIGSDNTVTQQFFVPSGATPGITGMRVITANGSSPNTVQPCGAFNSGEVEDYLIELVKTPCQKPTNPGIAYLTDSILCPGYTTIIYDTNHTKLNSYSGLTMIWQKSINNSTWSDITGATSDSVMDIVTVKSYYRLKIVCNNQDTVYSNVAIVNMHPSTNCYTASGSLGGSTDSSDNGFFTIGPYSFISGGPTGPHLGNPTAIRQRTDYTGLPPIQLYTDSTYQISFYNILRTYNHADAKITMFIDYNNNRQYDASTEQVFKGISTATSFYLPGSFKTPDGSVNNNPALNTPVGLRLILNNDIGANNASDLGQGLYTSGETEDYMVVFSLKPIIPLGLNDAMSMKNIQIYPNPTNGLVFIDLNAEQLNNLNITVTTITGAEVFRKSEKNINGKYNTSIDLSAIAKGTYIIKLQSDRGTVVQKITLE